MKTPPVASRDFPLHGVPVHDVDGIPTRETSRFAKWDPSLYAWAADEFDKRGILNVQFLGCSWTHGYGTHIPYPAHVCSLLSEAYDGVPVSNWNMGWGGRSNDFMARYGLCSFEHLRPDFVFICFTSLDRREYFRIDGRKVPYTIGFAHLAESGGSLEAAFIDESNAETLKHIAALSSPYEDSVNFLKNYKLLELTLNQLAIPWAFSMIGVDYVCGPIKKWLETGWLSADHYLGTPFLPIDRLSPGDGHPGVESHRRFGKRVYDWVQDRYGERLAEIVAQRTKQTSHEATL